MALHLTSITSYGAAGLAKKIYYRFRCIYHNSSRPHLRVSAVGHCRQHATFNPSLWCSRGFSFLNVSDNPHRRMSPIFLACIKLQIANSGIADAIIRLILPAQTIRMIRSNARSCLTLAARLTLSRGSSHGHVQNIINDKLCYVS